MTSHRSGGGLAGAPRTLVGVITAALNGSRLRESHPALPITPDAVARSAARCVAAGASSVHIHPRDATGAESLDPAVISDTVRRVRAAVGNDVLIGVSTGAWIEPHPERRVAMVARWSGPDAASVNLGEEGAGAVMATLVERGISVEAGVWSVGDAERLAASGMQDAVARVLVEIVHSTPDPVADARAIDAALDRLSIGAPRLLHGEDESAWPILRLAQQLGRYARIGLEDTLLLPDGTFAASNEQLVRIAGDRRGRTTVARAPT